MVRRARAKIHARSERAAIAERVSERTIITGLSLIEEAEQARQLAMALGQPAAAVSAIKEKGILSGVRIERKEAGQPGEFDHMTKEELEEWIAAEAEALGIVPGKRH